MSREILGAAGIEHAAFRVEMMEHLLDPRLFGQQAAVVRGHNAQTELLQLLNVSQAKAIVSFRDPRDAIASFMQRFGDYGARFVPVCNDVSRNLASLLSVSQLLDQLTFFFEDGFTTQPETVSRIAAFLEIPLTDAQAQAIFDKYSIASVRALTENIDSLDGDRLFVDQHNNAMDRETSFHRTHISDARVGKWKDVLDEEQRSAMAFFEPYRALLEEHATAPGRKPERNPGVSPLKPFTVMFPSALFAPVNSLIDFREFLTVDKANSGLGAKILEYVYLPVGDWAFRLEVEGKPNFTGKICQNGQVLETFAATDGAAEFSYLNLMHDHPFDLHIRYEGLEDDIAAKAPVPRARLQATLSTIFQLGTSFQEQAQAIIKQRDLLKLAKEAGDQASIAAKSPAEPEVEKDVRAEPAEAPPEP